MKKLRNTLLSAGILLTMTACSSGAPVTEEETAVPVAKAADYVGSWQADRATLIIEESGDDEYTATIHWGSSYNEAAEYEYKVYYDEVSAGLSGFENGTKKYVTYNDDGTVAKEEVIFEDGNAAFNIQEDGTLIWTDFKEAPGEDQMTFEKIG
jgi:hypothetical protein